MPWEAAAALSLGDADRELLRALARGGNTPQNVALRARIVLGAAEGRANLALARELGVSRPTVLLWRARYEEAGVTGLLKDAPRPGRKRRIGARKVEAVVNATLHKQPRDATHWSVRSMARQQGLSPATVHRIWQAHNLQPHRVERPKLSRNPDFVVKVRHRRPLPEPARQGPGAVRRREEPDPSPRAHAADPAAAPGPPGAADP